MNLPAYEAALQQAAWRNLSHFGRFRLRGKDAAALLHHLTTNDIKGLKPGRGCEAALISAKARVLDWLTIWRVENEFLVITSPNRRDMFRPHAQKFILFRQDVTIEDVTDSTTLLGLLGPQATTLSEVLSPPPGEVQASVVEGVMVQAARTTRLPGGGVLLWSQQKNAAEAAAGNPDIPVLDDETYNVLRLEAGVPVAGLELTEDVNPWEARLDTLVSLHKGCYNGQEIVARLNTYQKVKQRLFGLKLQTPVPMGTRAELKVEGRAAGFLSSSALSPRFGPIGLAYVRTDFQTSGQEIQVLWNEQEQIATVCELPFKA